MANPIVQLIIQGARARGLDPAAVLAVASREGLSGRIGDNGHAYGPFQLNNAGGVITNSHPGTYDQSIQQWASSPAGINFALDRIAGVARGQHGQQAVSSIVQRFERPANIPGEIAGAMGAYGDYSRGLPQGFPPQSVGTPPVQPPVPVRPQTMDAGIFNVGNQMLGLPTIDLPLPSAPQRPLAPVRSVPLSPAGRAVTPIKGKTAINYASSVLGVPYVWGGESTKGFDCSGLLQAAWAKAGVKIPRTTYDQFKAGTPVDSQHLAPGDAVFFKGSDSKVVNGQLLPGHVGIYIGNGQYIQAPHTGAKVEISNLAAADGFMGARRYS